MLKTFGNVDRARIQKQLEGQLGYKPRLKESPIPAGGVEEPKRQLPVPKTTEEPKTDVRQAGSRVVVDLELPGVKEGDVEVKELESSVEVRAIVGDKAFFKILTKPEQHSLVEKKFHNGKLHLEFA